MAAVPFSYRQLRHEADFPALPRTHFLKRLLEEVKPSEEERPLLSGEEEEQFSSKEQRVELGIDCDPVYCEGRLIIGNM